MSTRAAHRPIVTAIITLALVCSIGGCASPSTDPLTESPNGNSTQQPPLVGEGSASTPTTPRYCNDGLPSVASMAPVGSPVVAPGSTMAAIKERGALIVGVSADTLLMGSRNPFSGDIEGFDIEVAQQIAYAILGDSAKIRYRVITSDDRESVLTNHDVDIVVRAFTINCKRWENIAFSAEYYHSGQKLLVPATSTVQNVDDLAGKRVCAPQGTTTLNRLRQWEGVEAVPAATHTTCLVLFQQGAVDAITGDDTVLAGFAAQDPYAKVVGDAVSDEPYGVGIPADQPDMVRFVNGVLENMIAHGQWSQFYDRWLGDALVPTPTPPQPVYGRMP